METRVDEEQQLNHWVIDNYVGIVLSILEKNTCSELMIMALWNRYQETLDASLED